MCACEQPSAGPLLHALPARMPVMVLWGEGDAALDASLARDIAAACDGCGLHSTLVLLSSAG